MADKLIDLPRGIALRDVEDGDRDFLLGVYASTRDEELAVVPWSRAEKAAFVEMQFAAQDAHYRRVHPDGEFLVVTDGSTPIGRLYLAPIGDELRIIDIALVAERRGQGIGTTLVSWVLDRADRDGLAVSLHVEPSNPAKHLYERVGFETVEVRGPHELMRRRPARQLKTAS